MPFTRLMHIILGSTLTVFLILTAYNLLRLALAPAQSRGPYAAGTRRFALVSLALLAVYAVWIVVKRAYF